MRSNFYLRKNVEFNSASVDQRDFIFTPCAVVQIIPSLCGTKSKKKSEAKMIHGKCFWGPIRMFSAFLTYFWSKTINSIENFWKIA